jgi:hypothetical protein
MVMELDFRGDGKYIFTELVELANEKYEVQIKPTKKLYEIIEFIELQMQLRDKLKLDPKQIK